MNGNLMQARGWVNRLAPAGLAAIKRNRPRASARGGFTLIEVMMVVAIIAVLATLITLGLGQALNFSKRAFNKTEMAQLETGLALAARDLGGAKYIPSYIILKDDTTSYDPANPLEAQSLRLLQMMFPGLSGTVDWNGDGTANSATLTSDQAWVFFTGGIPSAGGPDGFSKGANPTVAGGKRKGPYFTFKPSRLVKQANGFYTYLDYWEKNSLIVYNNYSKDPSSFFNTSNLDVPTYSTPAPNRYFLVPTKMFNPVGYQIISAGKDGVFGTSQSGSSAATGFQGYGELQSPGGSDDQANFSDSLLSKPID